MKSQREAIFEMILKAVCDADDAGVRYLGLAALNKAEWINHGGCDIVSRLEEHRKIRIVHGNTLTAAAVWEAIKQQTLPEDEIVFAGSTSKIGRALCILLARRGNTVHMITGCQERFDKIRADAGEEAGKNLVRMKTYEEGKGYRNWIVGKQMSDESIKELVPLGSLIVDFAVPHVPVEIAALYRYVNGAALSYSRRDTDLTFCHDVPNTVPACLAATIIHAREDRGEHEIGEIEVEDVEGWWDRAVKNGFSLSCLRPNQAAGQPPAAGDAKKASRGSARAKLA
jgi:predicted amino acid dehydrogenase